jgi:dienelactone hydrolase
VALVGGHRQTQADLDAGNGVGAIANLLRASSQLNLSVHVYAEYVSRRQRLRGIQPPILTMGQGQAYTDFRRFYDQGHRRWAIGGYSHGGGITFQFAQRIANENPAVNPARLGFSAYIDAIQRTNADDHAPAPILAEVRRPPSSIHHLNVYELRSAVHGNNMGAQANQNIQRFLTDNGQPIGHDNIDDQPALQDYIADELVAHLQALP